MHKSRLIVVVSFQTFKMLAFALVYIHKQLAPNIPKHFHTKFLATWKHHLYILHHVKQKDPSPVHHDSNTTSHITTQDNLQIIGREDHGIARTITESIYIRVNNPTLYRNTGKLNLHHIWGRVLLNTPGLKINGHVQSTPPIRHSQSPNPTPPCTISQLPWSMSRPHLDLSMHTELPRTYIRHLISFLPQT